MSRPVSRARIIEWMQGWVDYTIMEMWGAGEVDGSAFAGILQRNVRAFIESAERDLGITLDGRGDLNDAYWTPEQHAAYHREEGRRSILQDSGSGEGS